MANFLHSREYLSEGDIAILECDTQCNFTLMDDSNFSSYRSGRGGYKYYGGHFKMFPARVAVPHTGHWNMVIDLGGGSANIKYALNYLKQS